MNKKFEKQSLDFLMKYMKIDEKLHPIQYASFLFTEFLDRFSKKYRFTEFEKTTLFNLKIYLLWHFGKEEDAQVGAEGMDDVKGTDVQNVNLRGDISQEEE